MYDTDLKALFDISNILFHDSNDIFLEKTDLVLLNLKDFQEPLLIALLSHNKNPQSISKNREKCKEQICNLHLSEICPGSVIIG